MRLLMAKPGFEGFDGIVAFEYETAQKAADDLFEILNRLQKVQDEFNETYANECVRQIELRDKVVGLQMSNQRVPSELISEFEAENNRVHQLWRDQPSYKFTFAGHEFELEDFVTYHDGVRQDLTPPEIRTVDSFFE